MSKVKCIYCNEYFDKNKEPFIQMGDSFSHKYCHEGQFKYEASINQDKEALHEYLKNLFGSNYNYDQLDKQMTKYYKEFNFKYSGMLGTLKYFFEVRENSIEKSHYRIGIIPYVYEEARDYYKKIKEINLKNQNKQVKNYTPTEREIVISSPKKHPQNRRGFNFLDEEIKS